MRYLLSYSEGGWLFTALYIDTFYTQRMISSTSWTSGSLCGIK